jgi:hypothetical protein
MTDIWQQPPADRPVQYVKFGPAPHQEIRAEVASSILTAWRDKNPKQFGEALAAAMLNANGTTP